MKSVQRNHQNLLIHQRICLTLSLVAPWKKIAGVLPAPKGDPGLSDQPLTGYPATINIHAQETKINEE